MIGHVGPGIGFLLLGLWHLYNHIKLYSLRPKTYVAPPWFPTRKLHHLELILIIGGSLLSIAAELFIGPQKHQPFDSDGTIPSNHLHNFEHAAIALTFLVYASFALYFDRAKMKMRDSMTHILAGIAFAQQYLLFHLHSADHVGIEGQYHWLLQLVIVVSLATTLIGIAVPKSFLISFVRSASIMFQGIWFIVMGTMIWIPSLLPKGCYLNIEEGHQVPRCNSEEAMDRAKALINLEFSSYLSATTIFCMLAYICLSKLYPEEPEYVPLVRGRADEEEDIEAHKIEELHSFSGLGLGFRTLEQESHVLVVPLPCKTPSVILLHNISQR
ncbi:hypothetical protein LUZ61_002877 [Rhynchospora tenuis]|uniref:Uncharacterized protein n=1 Tax=Rhynchospora tenuis TaxID=198213 RepID=A0AAD5ZJQ1_9POAL|nr:hypothetical protein LUZ61_002877 [Rhynchospora tenuis]